MKKVYNLEYLLNDVFEGNKDATIEIIDVFLADTPTKLEQINESFRSKNYYLLERLTHSLKSSIPLLGIYEGAKYCNEINIFAQNKKMGKDNIDLQTSYISEKIKKLNDILNMSFVQLQKYLDTEVKKINNL